MTNFDVSLMDNLEDFRELIERCRRIEVHIWEYIEKIDRDSRNYKKILDTHLTMEKFILELYQEIALIDERHNAYEHINTDSGRKIVELLYALKIKLARQYSDLIQIMEVFKKSNKDKFSEEEILQIRNVLDGNKNGQNESENSQQIRQIEKELELLITSTKSIDNDVKVSVNGKEIFVEKKHSGGFISFEQSLDLIQSKGYSRHLAPIEYFALRKSNNELLNLDDEFVDMLVRSDNGILEIATGPRRVEKKSFHVRPGYIITGTNGDYNVIRMPIGNLIGRGVNLSYNFPDLLRQFVGPNCVGIEFIDNEEWWPMRASYSQDDGGFILDTNLVIKGYSRGVR